MPFDLLAARHAQLPAPGRERDLDAIDPGNTRSPLRVRHRRAAGVHRATVARCPPLARYFTVPPTRAEKAEATATAPSATFSPSAGSGRGAGPNSTSAPFFGS